MKNQSGPMLDAGLSALIADLDERGSWTTRWSSPSASSAAARRRGVSTSGNSNNADGRDHWPYCYTAVIAGAGIKRGYVHGKSDKTGSAPLENPVHPTANCWPRSTTPSASTRTRSSTTTSTSPRELVKATAQLVSDVVGNGCPISPVAFRNCSISSNGTEAVPYNSSRPPSAPSAPIMPDLPSAWAQFRRHSCHTRQTPFSACRWAAAI